MTISTQNEETQSGMPEVWTVQRVLTWSAAYLKEKSREVLSNHRLDAELLLASVLELDRMKLYLQLDRPLSKDEREDFKSILRRRLNGEPVAYILGYRDFYRHRFMVNASVLIPRPETEMLVEAAIKASGEMTNPKILDVGTGSGCVAISIAAELPNALVTAWDVSEQAIDVARANAEKLAVSNLSVICHDAADVTSESSELFDVIVSNPPYIAQYERSLMSFSTLTFEPKLALFTNDEEGLQFYEIFSSCYQSLLRAGGKIFLEIGLKQGEKVAQLFRDAGWRKIEIVKDLSGHDRMVSAERP